MPPEPGLSASLEYDVSAGDTATVLGSGDVPVLATPRVLAWLEAATVAAVQDALAPGETSVGVQVELQHLAPSRVGGHVRAQAQLMQVDGRRLTFTVRLEEGDRVLATGLVQRAVVDRERFGA